MNKATILRFFLGDLLDKGQIEKIPLKSKHKTPLPLVTYKDIASIDND